MHVNPLTRASSMSTALSSLHKSHALRRTNSAITGISPRSLRVVVLGVGGVGKTGIFLDHCSIHYDVTIDLQNAVCNFRLHLIITDNALSTKRNVLK